MTFDWKSRSKDLGILLVVAGFVAFLNPYNAVETPAFIVRWAYWSGLALIGAIVGVVAVRLSLRILKDAPWYAHIFTAPPIIAVFVTPAVQGLSAVMAPGRTLPPFLDLYWLVLVLSVGMTALILMMGRAGVTNTSIPVRPLEHTSGATPAQDTAMSRFLKRLPLRYRDCRLLALSAEDHYLRVHTNMGEELILMRLSDAVTELDEIDGLQVHRSWWVARSSVTGLQREGARTFLTIEGDRKIPVSRTNVKRLREADWI